MNLQNLLEYTQIKVKEYPKLKDEIISIYVLSCNEVQNGESEMHEVELAISDIDQRIEEENEKNKQSN